ncbi:GNAT family N-acetyltransferase [Bacillus sp. FJAT-42376]|uniref:GNAT family N-acetyltransferase n=1 Tax=Bacillus sp. FJAT-42376 TaxID=2014076 RepID=UPI000F504619|nr:GNAT family N-acetyltransferase [Bacillus sp. FJAT-42376]AZB44942.1 GNAT family N-acetyltransferase [Bacillus sp. FJAT-42376]
MKYRDAYMDFYKEWKESGEKIVPWIAARDPVNFSAYLQYMESEKIEGNISPHFVPHSTYWLIDEAGKVVGSVNVRHRLNDSLLQRGGHIGYGIRPSEREKGYAAAILTYALEKTRELGITEVLVTCDQKNIASEKTIIKNGGQFDSLFTDEDGSIVKRFWIKNE